MTVKEKIIQRINTIENPEVLDEVLRLISTESELDQRYYFNPDERLNIMEGVADADAGRVYNQAESDQNLTEWLKKRSIGH